MHSLKNTLKSVIVHVGNEGADFLHEIFDSWKQNDGYLTLKERDELS